MHDATLGAAGRHTRFPAARRRRWLSLVTAALVLVIGPGAIIVANKQSAHAESDNRQFILITAEGGRWSATARLSCRMEDDECKPASWNTGPKLGGAGSLGGRAIWHFDGSEHGEIVIQFRLSRDPFGDMADWTDLGYFRADRSHCFRITVDHGVSHAVHTGDSVTGGCTPD